MNILRFLRKCLTDPSAAWRSARLVGRSAYSRTYWALHPRSPLRYRLPSGGVLLLERGHSFTSCFWPGVDQYEPDVHAALFHFLKPGDTFLDCGANIGYFSVLAGDIVGPTGQVIAIDANPITYKQLERNLALNRIGRTIHCALTIEPKEMELFVPQEGGDVYSSLRKGGLVCGEAIDSFRVAGRTLDEVVSSLSLGRIELMKIDIEGAELEVLRSAKNVMCELRPVVICEYGTNTWPAFGASAKALLALLNERHYRVGTFDVTTKTLHAVETQIWDAPYANLILLPVEHAAVKFRL